MENRSSSNSLFQKLQRRKHVNANHSKSQQLAKNLSILQLIPIGVGSTIGAGVYVLVGTVARERSGPSLTLSFLIAGIAAALSAFCYAELASRCPSAGSAYHYSYLCVGEGVAWIIGWALILEYTVGGSAVARGISPNLALLIGGEENLPVWLSRTTIPWVDIEVDPCAALLVVLVTILLCAGVKESATVQAAVTFANVCVLIFVIVAGAVIGFKSDWVGYRLSDGYLPFGINGMLGGAATVFFAYIGFDTVASTAEEVRHPQRDLPLGIGLSLSICAGLYMLVSAVIVGIVPYDQMDVNTPISAAFSLYGVDWAMYVVSAGAVAALSSTLMGSLLPQPRILMAMARDGLLPPFFESISTRTWIPINGTIATGTVAMLMAFFMDVDQLSGMVSVGTLLAFAMVGVSILVLRYVPPADTVPVISSTSILTQPEEDTTVNQKDGTVPLLGENVYPSVSIEGTPTQKGFLNRSDSRRRQLASWSLFGSCGGAVFIAVGACGGILPMWLRWLLAMIGATSFIVGAIVLGLLEQDEKRHDFGHSGGFMCPFIPWFPLASILINVYLLADLGFATWLRVGVWLIIGVAVYMFYGIKHSALSTKESRLIP